MTAQAATTPSTPRTPDAAMGLMNPHPLTPAPEPCYSYDNLTAADTTALCERFGIPTPTPDVPFADCAGQKGYDPKTLYFSLQNTTDPRLMIAAAVIRGTVRRLPDDARLAPQPHRASGPARPDLFAGVPTYARATEGQTAAPRTPAPRAPATRPVTPRPATAANPEMQRKIIDLAPNPAKPGSNRAMRYELYKVGMTLAEARAAGVKQTDIERHVAQGLVKLSPQEGGEG